MINKEVYHKDTMGSNLKNVEKNLRSIAKRYKSVKYSIGLAILFLMMGVNAFSEEVVSANVENTSQVMTRPEIKSTAAKLQERLDTLKKENGKDLVGARLELIKLMEQGDQVVKSPWSSWQFGANFFYDHWGSSYKGRGDKAKRYPYEGKLTRETTEFNRYVSPNSSNYSMLKSSTSDITSASTTKRGSGNMRYGISSNVPVQEPVVEMELAAGVTPKTATLPAINVGAPSPAEPQSPKAIDFKPVDPIINAPVVENIILPTITAPWTANGDDMYIRDGANRTALAGYVTNDDVAMISQYSTNGGTLNVKVNNGSTMDISSSGVIFKGHKGSTHDGNSTYSTDLNTTGYNGYSAFKLIGGHEIKIENTTINLTGEGTSSYNRWLFHTDGHNDNGESTWNIGENSKININGNNLVLYTSQYHSNYRNYNIGFLNDGTIETKGKNNIGWLGLHDGGSLNRQQYFYNRKGNITFGGEGDIFAYVEIDGVGINSGWNITNDNILKMTGNKQFGVVVSNRYDYQSAELLLNKPIEILGENSIGLALKGWADLDGGTAFSQSSADNIVYTLPATSRESILNFDLAGKSNIGTYVDYTGSNPFVIGNTTINSDAGENNTLVFIKNGQVTINPQSSGSTDNSLNITAGKNNVGLYTASTSTLSNGAKINITNSDSSVGIYAKNSGAVTNTGAITASGKSIKAIIADGSAVTNTGAITVDGQALSDTDGSAALVAQNGGTLTTSQGATSNIKVAGSSSLGAYADAGTIKLYDTTITAEDGAFNVYSKGVNGLVEFVSGNKIVTGQKSLAFNTDNNGVIKFGPGTVADIAGGTNADTRGTAFLYRGSSYSPFNQAAVSTWAANRFGSTLNNLTLNMASGSRLFIAQDVLMDLSDTDTSNLFAAGTGPTINGSDYKSFMLYLSKLKLNQNINLDNPTDAYNMLEVANSSVENNNSNEIKGTQAGQVAIAQENDSSLYTRNKVQLINNGKIELTGANSTAIYGKFAEIENTATGTIKMGDSSTALYGVGDSLVKNAGTIELGSNSTGMFSKEAETQALENFGTIKSTGTKAIGIIYDNGTSTTAAGATRVTNTATGKIDLSGEGSIGIYAKGTNYKVENSGEIKLGDATSLSNPNIGVYTDANSIAVQNNKDIVVGKNSIGIYGYNATNASGAKIETGDSGVGIYSKGSQVTLDNGSAITVGKDKAVGVFMANGGTLTSNGDLNIGENSYGIIGKAGATPFTFNGGAGANVTLGKGATYLYSDDTTAVVNNATNLTAATDGGNYGLYSAGTITNTGNIDFSTGIGNVGIYSTLGGSATNSGNIKVGMTDTTNKIYSIGMATDNGRIENLAGGTIDVLGADSIGMYAKGAGSVATNRGTINLSADRAMGMYIDENAVGHNYGTIQTVGNPTGAVGIVARKGSTFTNHPGATINISSKDGYAVFKVGGATINNQGTITISNGAKESYDPTATSTSKPATGGVELVAPGGASTVQIKVNGNIVPQSQIAVVNTPVGKTRMPAESSIGLYIDTLAGSNPITGLNLVTQEADLIFGSEATAVTNSKYIKVGNNILDPYNNVLMNTTGINWKLYSGALTWMSTVTRNTDGSIKDLYMAKIPYTAFAGTEPYPVETTDTYNFLDGLEQRYGVEALGSRERRVFDKLNSIGNNEEILFYQATDEMMGHQYANTQQRVQSTGNILDKEFNYLRREWANYSKDSNKVKTFGMRGEYKTDTAGVIDYRNHAYGVAYVHEDETVRLGKSLGWYAGIVHNTLKFRDIGNSREEMLQGKVGVFKSIPFDYNNSLNVTLSGELHGGYNKMNRRFLVVDEVFGAKGRYHTYGAAVKGEVSKEFRLSEDFTFKPYGALKYEYGRISKIREKSGEIKLEVKSNDYHSLRPEVGAELGFRHFFGSYRTLRASLGVAYENELGRVANGKNKARVAGTDADWFNIRGEKEDRKGNIKTDLKIGIDNSRVGLTADVGYDTKGSNIRGGLGLRVIF